MTSKKNFFSYSRLFILFFLVSLSLSQHNLTIVENNEIDIMYTQENDTTSVKYPSWLNSSQSQYLKFLSDKYNYYITPKGNKIWIGAMNLAWQQLKHKILNGNNVTFTEKTQLQTHIVDNLNSEVFTRQQLSPQSYYVYTGYGQQAITQINFDVKQKFPLRTLPELNFTLYQKDFISFAFMFKNFQFATPFEDKRNFLFKDQPVRAFHAKTSKQKNQVYCKYYNHSQDFMIGIKTQSPNDEILLWKTDIKQINGMRLQKWLQMFNMFYHEQSKPLEVFDRFIMPVIELDYTKKYDQMLNLDFANEQLKQYRIVTMQQNLKVKVTKEGVKLQAQAILIGTRMMDIIVRTFYLDNDFWLIMKEKNKHPYLISYISAVNQTISL